MAKKIIKTTDSAPTIAAELYLLEKQTAKFEELIQQRRKQLMDILKKQGVRQVRLDDGTTFVRAIRSALKVKSGEEIEAFEWADEHNALKVDTAKVQQILRHQMDMPPCFAKAETEYLTVRYPRSQ